MNGPAAVFDEKKFSVNSDGKRVFFVSLRLFMHFFCGNMPDMKKWFLHVKNIFLFHPP